MKYINEVLFLMFALLLLGLFISSLAYIKKTHSSRSNHFWYVALGLDILAFLFFASASTIDPILITFANTFFFGGYLFLAHFSRSLNKKPTKDVVALSIVLLIVFAGLFEYLRRYGDFQDRVLLVVVTLCSCLSVILYELFHFRKKEPHFQIDFLIFTSAAELILGLVRLWMVMTSAPNLTPSLLYQEPFVSTMVRWFAVSFTVLSYMSIIGYLTDNLSDESAANLEDGNRVKKLLEERDLMIASLIKANKSTSTEALSASIAHELNQPLGATLLNIQFLKMLHETDRLSPQLVGQVIGQLETDARRSGEIIRSLRSIFSRDSGAAEIVSIDEVVQSALAIYKSELISKEITIQAEVDSSMRAAIHKGQLLQALLNLINNAIQILHSENSDQKHIILRGYRIGANCILEIEDTGPGIPAHLRRDLFELLSTNKSNGMGIGLWLCKHVMNNFGGNIAYEAGAAGGAKFILTIPCAPGEM